MEVTRDKVAMRKKLKCPTCGGSVVIYSDGLACQKVNCGGIMTPMSLDIFDASVASLRRLFPDLISARAGNPISERSPTAKQPESLPGQMDLFPATP